MVVGQPHRPANMLEIVAVNQGRRPYSWDEWPCPLLTPAEAQRRIEEGARVLDTRDPADFAEGHPPGSWNVQLSSPQFEQRVGWILPPEQKIILLLPDGGDATEAIRKLAVVGLDQRVEGRIDLGAWRREGRPERLLAQMNVLQLQEALAAGEAALLDVRDDSEWVAGHVAGASHLPLPRLGQSLGALDLDPGKPLAVICAGGFRSSTACSLLLDHGFQEVRNVIGGATAWRRARLPMDSG